jgi:hypothetical protein
MGLNVVCRESCDGIVMVVCSKCKCSDLIALLVSLLANTLLPLLLTSILPGLEGSILEQNAELG